MNVSWKWWRIEGQVSQLHLVGFKSLPRSHREFHDSWGATTDYFSLQRQQKWFLRSTILLSQLLRILKWMIQETCHRYAWSCQSYGCSFYSAFQTAQVRHGQTPTQNHRGQKTQRKVLLEKGDNDSKFVTNNAAQLIWHFLFCPFSLMTFFFFCSDMFYYFTAIMLLLKTGVILIQSLVHLSMQHIMRVLTIFQSLRLWA